jgi:hypothetical protein
LARPVIFSEPVDFFQLVLAFSGRRGNVFGTEGDDKSWLPQQSHWSQFVVSRSLFAAIAVLALSVGSSFAIAGTAEPTNSQKHEGKLIEGRALYEAQINFGGVRENDLGPGFDFGVPLTSRAHAGTD